MHEPQNANRTGLEIAIVLAAGLLSVFRTGERDFWFHLAAGRSILEEGLPAAERWCRAALGQWPWLGEWLYHVSLYGVREGAGDLGVAFWRAAWTALAVGLALLLARRVGAGLWPTVLIAPLVLAVSRGRFVARPEQLTVAFVLLFLVLFEQARRSEKDRTPWLLALQVLWANLHPAWILGPLVAFLYAGVEALGREATARRRALRWGLLGLGLIAASAVTPRPLDTLSLRMLRDVFADPTVSQIGELQSWSLGEPSQLPLTGLVVLTLVAAALGGRRAWRASPALTLASLGALAAGLAFFRLRALGAFVAFPLLALALSRTSWPAVVRASFSPSTKRRRSGRRGRKGGGPGRELGRARPVLAASGRTAGPVERLWNAVPPGRAVAVLAAAAGLFWLVSQARIYPIGTAPLLRTVPVRAVALADSLGLEGPVLNTPSHGGYLLWIRGTDHPPLQDTRNLGTAEFRARQLEAHFDEAALDALIAEWECTYAVVEPPMSADDRMPRFLFERPGWSLIGRDDAGLLFVRDDRFPEIAERLAYRLWHPDYAAMAAVAERALRDSTTARALVAELERARRSSPWNSRAHLWLGLLALADRRPEQALSHFDVVERLAPVTPGLALRQGMAHQLLGDFAAARRAYRRALRDTADAGAARASLERIGG